MYTKKGKKKPLEFLKWMFSFLEWIEKESVFFSVKDAALNILPDWYLRTGYEENTRNCIQVEFGGIVLNYISAILQIRGKCFTFCNISWYVAWQCNVCWHWHWELHSSLSLLLHSAVWTANGSFTINVRYVYGHGRSLLSMLHSYVAMYLMASQTPAAYTSSVKRYIITPSSTVALLLSETFVSALYCLHICQHKGCIEVCGQWWSIFLFLYAKVA